MLARGIGICQSNENSLSGLNLTASFDDASVSLLTQANGNMNFLRQTNQLSGTPVPLTKTSSTGSLNGNANLEMVIQNASQLVTMVLF